jgi:hypothetical protein
MMKSLAPKRCGIVAAASEEQGVETARLYEYANESLLVVRDHKTLACGL